MSLLDERNFYKPFDYGWAYEAYKKQNQMHWMPEEVPLQDDLKDYKEKLTPENRQLVDNIFRFFTQADVDVCCGYAKHYLPTFKAPEVRMMLVSFAAMEAVHQDAYSLLLETLGKDDDIYSEFMDIQEMVEKHEYLSDFSMDTPHNIAKTMAVYSGFTEGVQLFSSFAILLNYPRHNLMKGMGQIVTWSIRDETLHVENVSRLFRTFIAENPEIWTDKLKYEIYCAAERVVELEDKFIDICFDKAEIPDLTAKEVKEYIRYIADRRLLQLGMKKIVKDYQTRIGELQSSLDDLTRGEELKTNTLDIYEYYHKPESEYKTIAEIVHHIKNREKAVNVSSDSLRVNGQLIQDSFEKYLNSPYNSSNMLKKALLTPRHYTFEKEYNEELQKYKSKKRMYFQ